MKRKPLIELCISALTVCAACASSCSCVGQVPKEAPAQLAGATQSNQPAAQTPATPEAFIDQLKKTVVFVTGTYVRQMKVIALDGSESRQNLVQSIRGTGFLVSLHETLLETGFDTSYLVTNKHMIREPGPTGELGQGPYLSEIVVRVNTRTPSANGESFTNITVPVMNLAGQMSCFVDTSDDDVDLALCPIAPGAKQWEFKTIGTDSIATSDKIKAAGINESNEILFAGLFAPFTGVKRNYPVVRHGKIAMLTGERVPILDRTAEVYIGDVMSFGGNSGSPVMVKWGGLTDNGFSAGGYYLLGTMQGYFNAASPVAVQTATLQGTAAENTGVAFIVPAHKILDIFHLPGTEYCRTLGIERYLDGIGQTRQAFDLAVATVRRESPSENLFWCEYSQRQFIVEKGKALHLPESQYQQKKLPDTIPNLLGRVNIKSSVHVEFTSAQPGIGNEANLFLIFESPDAYAFLVPGYEKPEAVPLFVPKAQVNKISFIQ